MRGGMTFWGRFKRQREAFIASCFLTVLLLLLLTANFVAPFRVNDLKEVISSPSSQHYLGTDELGRDVFSLILYGGRISFAVGLLSTTIAITIGIVMGSVAGSVGGWLDRAIMSFVDVMLSVPIFFLLLALSAFFTPGFSLIALLIGASSWMHVARLLRANILALNGKEFTEAARALGISPLRLIALHLLPNSTAPLIVAFTLGFGQAVMTESALSFLGFGLQPPGLSWGSMLSYAQETLIVAPWASIAPGAMIFFTVLAINFLGDGLREALKPIP